MLRHIRADEGATMTEYALLVACIAVVVIGALQLLGTNTSGALTPAGTAISTGRGANGGGNGGGNGQGEGNGGCGTQCP